ncbi:hypothetical protein IFM89_011131 [Coptis chinensis]|uniref:Pentatricopeptide repeat-containing protein n=1 Tax=Coptis chinensis TaxID=261450 RepID=A0A835HLM8_9MAGN|nr:hypothetical protein IFM89_011131 [Coptis chinensis]
MYAKCGSLVDSRNVFDHMPERNIISYNAIISAYSKQPQQAIYAFELLPKLLLEEHRPNNTTLSNLVQAAYSVGDMLMGSALHSMVVKYGFCNDIVVQTSLLGMYSSCGNLEYGVQVFNGMVVKDAIAWNSVIFGSMKNDRIRQGLTFFSNMVRAGFGPTQFTYTMILNACSRLRYYISGQVIHAQVIKNNEPPDTPLQNALVDMYSSCGDNEAAYLVFRKIEFPDLVSWNSVIAGYMENSDGETAMSVFIQLCQMAVIKPDEYTFATTISAVRDLPSLDYGSPLHAHVEKAGFGSSIFVGSTLISMYLKHGEIDSAEKLLNSITEKDVIVWTEMISGISKLGDSENALKYFYQVLAEGHKVDSFVLSCVLSSCADLASLKQGEMIHSQAVKTGYEEDMCVCGSLVDMYVKTGNLPAAELIFFMVPDPDLKCWNSLLGGYSNHGKAEEAINLFDEILKQGLRPDQVTFISMLSACSHCGLVEGGKFFWNYMKREGLEPGLKHYSCMVSLLSRAGLLQEAKILIDESPCGKDSLDLWRTLLSSCITYRTLELGVYAAEQVLTMDAEDTATLVMLSNLYAGLREWDAVREMRRKVRSMMLEKDPGLSWIDIMSEIHVFASDDQSHPQLVDAQFELQRLSGNMIKSEAPELYA